MAALAQREDPGRLRSPAARPRTAPAAAALLATVLAVGCSPGGDPPARVELRGYRPASAAGLLADGWRTDLSRLLVPLGAIRVGDVARESFLPIEDPRFDRAASIELAPQQPVLVYRGAAGLRAWPLVSLLRRELALDRVDSVPVAVTLCSLCASARAFDRRLDGEVLDLRVSGLLLDGNALLYDRQTQSLWRQLDGLAVAGTHAGRRLEELTTFTVSLGALRDAHPEAPVMLAPERDRDPPLALISAVDVARGIPPPWLETACADPFALVLSSAAERMDSVVLRDPSTQLPYPASREAPGGDGSAAAFRSALGDRPLTFDATPAGAVDRETGSTWNLLGEAVDGPLCGARLEVLPQVRAFRFALEAMRALP